MSETLKTVIILLLFVLLVFLGTQVWMVVPMKENILDVGAPASQDTREDLEDFVQPSQALLNFGYEDQTLVYDLRATWPSYYQVLKSTLQEGGLDTARWESLAQEDYLALLDQPSIVFIMENRAYGLLLRDLLGLPSQALGPIKEVYFPLEGGYFVLANKEGQVRVNVDDVSMQDMSRYLRSVYEGPSYTPYMSLYKTWGQARQVYLPDGVQPWPADLIYQNEIALLSPKNAMDLAERFLSRPLEDIQLVEEEGASLYVYEQKSLRLNESGLLSYYDAGIPSTVEPRITGLEALRASLAFMADKVGVTEDLVLTSLETEDDGWSLTFNRQEGARRVVPLDGGDYFSIRIQNSRIRNFRMVYRTPVDLDPEDQEEVQTAPLPKKEGPIQVPVRDFISENIEAWEEALGWGLTEASFYQGLRRLRPVYVDRTQMDQASLVPAYEFYWEDRVIYVDQASGAILREVEADGLV